MGRRIAFGLLTLAFISGALARTQLQLEWSPESIRDLVQGFGLWGPLVFIVLVALRLVLVIPSQVMLVAAGICFGFVEGTLYGSLGVTLSGLIAFGLARALGGRSLADRVPPGLRRALEHGGRRGGALVVLLGTGYPVGPMTAFHLCAGLTTMPLGLFTIAVLLGALLRSVLFTFVGSSLVERGVLGAWPALLPLLVLLAPLLHGPTRTRVRALLFADGARGDG